jgi:hypothetical protein
MRILNLILVLTIACNGKQKNIPTLNAKRLLRAQYSVPLLVKSNRCEGISELMQFSYPAFRYREICLGNPEQKVMLEIRGNYRFVNDSIVRLRGDTDSMLIQIRDSTHISILEINGKKSYDFPLGYDTAVYNFK